MKRYQILLLSLVAAVACYAVGLVHAAGVLLVCGMLFEGIFWFHLLVRRKRR